MILSALLFLALEGGRRFNAIELKVLIIFKFNLVPKWSK